MPSYTAGRRRKGCDMCVKEYRDCAEEMLRFIEDSPSCFHAVDNVRRMLLGEGFQQLSEGQPWELIPGRGYFTVRNDSSLIGFRLPEGEAGGFHLAAAHSDSPSFKVKENPEMTAQDRYVRLNTEKYGGMILSSWMDRALSVAGRVAVGDSEGRIVTRLVNIDRDLLVIPNLAIHMNREMNKGVEYNPQTDMPPLFAETFEGRGSNGLLRLAAEAAGAAPEDILGQDLFLYVREKGRILGERGEYVLSPRLDDLQCVYAAARAFGESIPRGYINVCAVFDNEEVGSGTGQGADSTFLEDVLERIAGCLGADREGFLRLLAGSFLISADNAHGVHPNHPEKADPTNRPYLNGGIVIKFHGGQKYTTDGVSAARMRDICRRAGVPCQTYSNRSDQAGGSTLGNISTAHVSVSSVDIGLPQLAMHSAAETAGVKDTLYCIKALKEFFTE